MSTDPFETQNAFTLLPNPVQDILSVYSDQATLAVNALLIYDLSGRLVGESKANTIQVNDLTKGTYLLQIIDQEGKVYPKKFLKN